MTEKMLKMAFDRQTAIKASIAMLLSGKYVVGEGDEPNRLLCGSVEVSRANLLGVVVSKESSDSAGSASLLVDDSTGRLSVRAFGENREINDTNVGDPVLIIGKPREYGGEGFLAPEIIRKIDNPKWIEVRKHELALVFQHKKAAGGDLPLAIPGQGMVLPKGKEQVVDAGRESRASPPEKEGKQQEEAALYLPQEEILTLIKTLDRGEGADVERIIGCSTQKNSEQIIDTLLKNGDVFELKPGKLKVLE